MNGLSAAVAVVLTLGQTSGPASEYHPSDAADPWVHGYVQERPAFGGYASFRPYNYKHVYAQSLAAATWGLDPQRPYCQDLWKRPSAVPTHIVPELAVYPPLLEEAEPERFTPPIPILPSYPQLFER